MSIAPRLARAAPLARLLAASALAALLSLAAGCLPWDSPPPERTGPPNVVVIFVDDLGYRDVGYNGAASVETPNIDRLAAEGVIFANGYVAHPFCGPSRAGLMTGRYPARFGMEWNLAWAPGDPEHGLPAEETTFATRLRDAGYRTGLVGKWQLGAAPVFHPLNRGVDYFYGFLGGGHDYFEVDAARSPFHEYYLPLGENRGAAGFEGYLTDALTDRAVAFIGDEHPRDPSGAEAAADGGWEEPRQPPPFFLYLAYNAPHAPLQAPAGLIAKYSHILDEDRRAYLAMVDSLDRNVGRVIDALEDSGQREDTIVFFLSDNGGVYPLDERIAHLDWADNGPLREGKNSFHEGGVRVPFVASWPGGWPQGATYEPMVSSLDIAATAMGLAGAAEDPERPLDGVDLDPYLRGEAAGPPHEALYWRQWSPAWFATFYAVRSGDDKLVRTAERAPPMLFDLASDPSESRDLFAEDRETAERLAALWNDWNDSLPPLAFPHDGSYRHSVTQLLDDWRSAFLREREDAGAFRIALPAVDPALAATCRGGVAVPDPEDHPGLVEDCAVLLSAVDALRGDGELPWTADIPIHDWRGVGVSGGASPRVAAIVLLGRGLTGVVPPQLGSLPALRELRLTGNELTGGVPPELGALAALQVLAISDNRLTGGVPPELGALASLRELRLADNMLTSALPPELGSLPRLTVLSLKGNAFEGCVPPGLRQAATHDLGALGLADCAP